MSRYQAPVPPIYRRFKPHFLFYEVVSVIKWVISYTYRKILEMLFKMIELCEIMGAWGGRGVGIQQAA